MKILVIDNDLKIRTGLVQMLGSLSVQNIEIAEASGVVEGVSSIAQFNPDLVFLDVEMDDGTGFDLLRKLDHFNFQLVFITAHNKYAVDAFKFSALDYLLKPINPEELAEVIDKAQSRIKQNKLQEQLEILTAQLGKQSSAERKIALRDSESVYIVRVADILHCKAEGSYTRIFFTNQSPILLSRSLKDFEEMLSPFQFIRCHHSHLISANAIVRFDKSDGGTLQLTDGTEIPVSFRKKEHIIDFLNRL
jgi:two-component system LytT family response regulator